MHNHWVLGVDVCKAQLDCYAVKEGEKPKEASFSNDQQGIRKLIKFLRSLQGPCWVGMESTGGYELDLATAVFVKKIQVSVINPARIKNFARAKGIKNKTDKLDARTITSYLQKMDPTPWKPEEDHIQKLRRATRNNRTLVAEITRNQNQLNNKR